jgi:hypothetical protein
VDDKNFLWKAQEKGETNFTIGTFRNCFGAKRACLGTLSVRSSIQPKRRKWQRHYYGAIMIRK